jgi:hypothetical protein
MWRCEPQHYGLNGTQTNYKIEVTSETGCEGCILTQRVVCEYVTISSLE